MTEKKTLGDYIGIVIVLLMAFGTVFVFSASANLNQELDLHRFYDFRSLRQILFFPLAVLLMYSLSRFNYRRLSLTKGLLKSPVVYLLGFSVVLLIIVLLPQFGTEVNGARRWLRIPAGPASISFQPSELAKWSLIFFLAGFCDKFCAKMKLFWDGFAPVAVIIAAVIGLIITQDLGTAAFISALACMILLIGGARWWHVLAPLPLGVVAFIAMLIRSPSRMSRISAFLHPEKWADSAAYQTNQSLIAIGSGGLFGKGLGRGVCKYGYLPDDTTDFVFAIIGEELGFVGTAAVILLFVIFVWLGILVVARCRDRFGQMLAAGIVLSIGLQAAFNMGVVTVVIPAKGIPLPFVSAGGTSMLLSAAAVGLLLNIAKQSAAQNLLGDEE